MNFKNVVLSKKLNHILPPSNCILLVSQNAKAGALIWALGWRHSAICTVHSVTGKRATLIKKGCCADATWDNERVFTASLSLNNCLHVNSGFPSQMAHTPCFPYIFWFFLTCWDPPMSRAKRFILSVRQAAEGAHRRHVGHVEGLHEDTPKTTG